MSGESVTLQGNPCFGLFMETDELFELAAARQWVVLAPVTSSLRFARISIEFVRTHILRKSPYFKDKYCTLDDRDVEFDGKTISTAGKGWPQERTAVVLEEELYYDSNFQSFRVLHISQPLIGRSSARPGFGTISGSQQASGAADGVSASSPGSGGASNDDGLANASGAGGSASSASFDAASAAAKISLSSSTPAHWRQQLQNLMGNPSPALFSKALLEPLRHYIQGFNQGFVLVKGERFMKLTAQTIREEIERLAQQALVQLGKRLSHEDEIQFRVHLENLVMSGIHAKLFNSLKILYEDEEAKLRELVFSLQHLSMADLKIRPAIVCQPNLAIRRLALLDSRETPVGKLQLLHNVNALLHRAVEEQCRRPREESRRYRETSGGVSVASAVPSSSSRDGSLDGVDSDAESDDPQAEDESEVLNADDVLPLTVFMIIQAYTKTELEMHLLANIVCMQHFVLSGGHPHLSMLRMLLANFTAAVEFLRSGKLERYRLIDGALRVAALANQQLVAGGVAAQSAAGTEDASPLMGAGVGVGAGAVPIADHASHGKPPRMANARSLTLGRSASALPGSVPVRHGAGMAGTAAVGPGSVGGAAGGVLHGWRPRLTEFLRRYDPSKLAQLEFTLEAFRDREQLLFDSLYQKYNVSREDQRLWQQGIVPPMRPQQRVLQPQRQQPQQQGLNLARSYTLDAGMGGRNPYTLQQVQQQQQQQRMNPQQQQQRQAGGAWGQRQGAAPEVVDLPDAQLPRPGAPASSRGSSKRGSRNR